MMTNGHVSPMGEKLRPMSPDQARACIDAIKERVEDIRILILDLYEREGWKSLGYGSWRECVVAEFDQSESYMYRQLQAMLIEREISPIGEKLGSIPEGQLRPLAKLAEPEQRREAWEEARATAPAGKPTAKHVAAAVDRRLGKPAPAPKVEANGHHQANGKSKVNGVFMDDPPEIAHKRLNGKIGADVIPEIEEPAPGHKPETELEPEPEPGEADIDDETWLATLPIRSKLTGAPLKWFVVDAFLYRTLESARKTFQHHARRALNDAKRKGGNGQYAYQVSRFLRINHPKHWNLCPSLENGGCGGSGTVGLIGQCPRCHGKGYWIL